MGHAGVKPPDARVCRTVVVAGRDASQYDFQLLPRRRVLVPRRVASQDEWGIRQVGLDYKCGLFSFWHWHQPWGFLSVIASFLIAGWVSRRYQSSWIFLIARGVDGVFMSVMLLLVIAGH